MIRSHVEMDKYEIFFDKDHDFIIFSYLKKKYFITLKHWEIAMLKHNKTHLSPECKG